MTIKPLKNIIQVSLESAKAGVLDTSSRLSAVEYGEVISVGEGVSNVKKGDHVFVKSWAIDKISHNQKDYYFINTETGGVLAVVK